MYVLGKSNHKYIRLVRKLVTVIGPYTLLAGFCQVTAVIVRPVLPELSADCWLRGAPCDKEGIEGRTCPLRAAGSGQGGGVGGRLEEEV